MKIIPIRMSNTQAKNKFEFQIFLYIFFSFKTFKWLFFLNKMVDQVGQQIQVEKLGKTCTHT